MAPYYPSQADSCGSHGWLVEFRVPPPQHAEFAWALDDRDALRVEHRFSERADWGCGDGRPRVIPMPPATVYRWMRQAGKLGDQHKVPRVTNDRVVANSQQHAGTHRLVEGAPAVPGALTLDHLHQP